jgi:hypothetical protein
MTWCSEYSAVPRCLPARSAIRCRSVDRFVGFSVPSHVSLQRFSPRDASLSSVGSQRARFPDFAGTMKALRLPSQACPGPLWVRFQAPQASLCSCSPQRSRRGRVRVRAWALMSRAALSGTLPEDLLGISQVPWRSIPDLCPALGPRLDQQDLAMAVLPVLPPGPTHRRLQRVTCRGSTPGFGLRCLRFTSVVADAHARLASGWRAAPLPGGCRTLWNAMEGFRLHHPPSQLSHPLIFDFCGPRRCFRKAACNLSLLSRTQKVQEHGDGPSPAVGGNMAVNRQAEPQRIEIASQKMRG